MKKHNTLVSGFEKGLLFFAAEEDSYGLGLSFFKTILTEDPLLK
jgi:hypothetical protein